MLMQRENVREDEETTMVRFVDGLNVSIANALNLQTYICNTPNPYPSPGQGYIALPEFTN